MPSYSDSTLTVDLATLAKNYQLLSKQAGKATCAAVVKANAYGLGVGPVAKRLAAEGCEHFFVATFEEAVELRSHIKKPAVYVFHGLRKGQEGEAVQLKVTPVLNDAGQLALWRAAANKAGKKLPAVLHFDTGMNRLGFPWQDAAKVKKEDLTQLDLQWVMSHLACANEPEHELNKTQLKRLNEVRKNFPSVPVSFANSAGVFLADCYHFALVRPGVALYGVNPTGRNPMHAVASLHSKILQLRELGKAEPVGYGATQMVPAGHRLATVPVGYADGYLRSLSGKADGYIEGKRVPVVGRVSMDLIVLDVTDIPAGKLSVGSEVELLGKHITVDTLAKQAGTIGYEILTRLGARHRKQYIGERA
jgi:alanine racemase